MDLLTTARVVLAALAFLGRILLLLAARRRRCATVRTDADPARSPTATERTADRIVTAAQIVGAALAVIEWLHDAGIVPLW